LDAAAHTGRGRSVGEHLALEEHRPGWQTRRRAAFGLEADGEDRAGGRIFSYDVAGGRYEEHRFYSIGSGSVFARGSLKKLYREGMSAADTILACMHALYDAADDDSATGGPDLTRRIYPKVLTVDADGVTQLSDDEAATFARAVVDERMQSPDGPTAPLQSVIPNR